MRDFQPASLSPEVTGALNSINTALILGKKPSEGKVAVGSSPDEIRIWTPQVLKPGQDSPKEVPEIFTTLQRDPRTARLIGVSFTDFDRSITVTETQITEAITLDADRRLGRLSSTASQIWDSDGKLEKLMIEHKGIATMQPPFTRLEGRTTALPIDVELWYTRWQRSQELRVARSRGNTHRINRASGFIYPASASPDTVLPFSKQLHEVLVVTAQTENLQAAYDLGSNREKKGIKPEFNLDPQMINNAVAKSGVLEFADAFRRRAR